MSVRAEVIASNEVTQKSLQTERAESRALKTATFEGWLQRENPENKMCLGDQAKMM